MSHETGGPYFPQELREQPDAIRSSLADTAPARKSLAERASEADRVLVVGSGDSIFLGHAAVVAFERLAGIPAEAVEAYDFITARASLVDRSSLVIGVSASGKAVRTVQAIEMAARAGALTVGLTDTPDSALSRAAGATLLTTVGTSYSFPTKTTTSALAVLAGLAADLGLVRDQLATSEHAAATRELDTSVPEAIERRLSTNEDFIAAAEELAARRQAIFVGSGACRASALVGAAKIQETCHEPAMAVNAEDYLHLTGFVVGREQAVIVVSAEETVEREMQVADYAARQGAAVFVVCAPETDDAWPDGSLRLSAPIEGLAPYSGALVAMVSLHLLAGELSRIRGRNPDRPEGVDVDYVVDLLYSSSLPG